MNRRKRFIGLLQLETRFPRLHGDIGNPATFDFPVRIAVVAGAAATLAVHGDRVRLLGAFVATGRQLVADGAVAITTSCGFLAPLQRVLAAALPVPVATSPLLQVPWLAPLLPPSRRVGVVTIDADALGADVLTAAGAPADTPVVGLPRDGELATTVFEDRETLDAARAQAEVVEAGYALQRRFPQVGAIVLECTNLPPYRRALAEATGLPVFDSTTLLEWLWRGAAAASVAIARPR